MKVMIQLCEFGKSRDIYKLFPDLYATNVVYRTMMEIAPDMNETFASCKLFGKLIDCDEIFFPILTDAGFCYAFNTIRLPEFLTDE